MTSRCWRLWHGMLPVWGCGQHAASVQRRRRAPGDGVCIRMDTASSSWWWSVLLTGNTSWVFQDTQTQKIEVLDTIAQPSHEESLVLPKAKYKSFGLFPLTSPSLSWTLILAECLWGAGNCPGCISTSYSSAQWIQVFGNEKQTTHYRKLPPSLKKNKKNICCPLLLCNAVIMWWGSNHLVKGWTKLHH